MKFCKLDIPKFCKDIRKGEGKTIECLKKNYRVRLLCLVIHDKKNVILLLELALTFQ